MLPAITGVPPSRPCHGTVPPTRRGGTGRLLRRVLLGRAVMGCWLKIAVAIGYSFRGHPAKSGRNCSLTAGSFRPEWAPVGPITARPNGTGQITLQTL